MSDKQPIFIHTNLEFNLKERLEAALNLIGTLSKKEVSQCNNAGLTELVRQRAIVIPLLRPDLMVADERVIEVVDITFERKTGETASSFFIPVEGEIEWFNEVRNQIVPTDDRPLAFLDKKHNRIDIRLMLSPKDEDGALKRKLDYRATLIAQYANSVATKITAFNAELAIKI